jgi:tripartite ATP-independent transporter DctM subunit
VPTTILSYAALLFGLMIIGVPVGFSIGLASLILLLIDSGFNANYAILIQRMFNGVDSFPLLAVPLFMIAGNLMNTAGITRRIFGFATALVGHFRLGLGQVNVVASMIFAGMSGAAVADAAGLGPIEMKAMLDAKYDRGYSAAITAASSTIGPIIPPSIPLVIYGIMAEASIGRLLIGGIIPGCIIGGCLMVINNLFARRRGYPKGNFVGMRELWRSFKQAFFPLLTPVILVGGMLSGVFTPTEAAAVAVFYAFFLGYFVYREITLKDLLQLVKNSMRGTAEIMFIVAAACAFAYMVISAQIPVQMVDAITTISKNPWVILFIINIILLIIGCLMEPVAAITIVVPVLMPLVRTLGIDPVHFGLVVVYNLVIGLLTPPVGLVLFVTSKVAEISVEDLVRELLPFFVPLLAALFLITYIPSLVTFLPNLLMGK